MANVVTANLTEEEKVRARHHTGYLGVGSAQTFYLGIPAQVQTQFQIEGAFQLLLPASLPKFRELLAKLDAIEEQMFEDNDTLVATTIGSIGINQDEHKKLRVEYKFWQGALCNMLGVIANPYDFRFTNGGINVPVSG